MVAAFRGRFASQGPAVNVAVRTSAGWTGRKNGSQAPLSGDVVRELDALLKNPALWREAPFWPEMDCPDAGALLMVVRHQGRERVTRQACGTNGLTGRLLETVAAEAIPTGTSRY